MKTCTGIYFYQGANISVVSQLTALSPGLKLKYIWFSHGVVFVPLVGGVVPSAIIWSPQNIGSTPTFTLP